jgi:hypothetical protein
MAKSKSVVLAASFKVLAFFGCRPRKSLAPRQPDFPCLRPEPAHSAKSKEEVLLWSKLALGEHRMSLRSSEKKLKYKTKVQEHKEPEFGTVGAISLQGHERPNHSFKRTPDGAA